MQLNRDDVCSECGQRLDRPAFDAPAAGFMITMDSQDENEEVNLMALRTKSDRPHEDSPTRIK